MFKLILKIAVVYAVLQYGFQVDINGYIKPYFDSFVSKAEDEMPDSAKELLEQAAPLVEAASDNAVVDYVKDRANAIDDAKDSVKELEEKMKAMQKKADEILEEQK